MCILKDIKIFECSFFFTVYPTDGSLKTSSNITEWDMTVSILFTEVYPVPECNILLPYTVSIIIYQLPVLSLVSHHSLFSKELFYRQLFIRLL